MSTTAARNPQAARPPADSRTCEETSEEQFAQQLDGLQLDERALTGLRAALTELHGQERKYRTAAMTALRARNDGVHKEEGRAPRPAPRRHCP